MPETIQDFIRSRAVSGTYERAAAPAGTFTANADGRETVRLDVDGTFPQMMASGSYSRSASFLAKRTHWVAYPLRRVGSGTWEGDILMVWGDRNVIPHTKVVIHVPQGLSRAPLMTITFTGGPAAVTRTLHFVSPYFREVEFEFDVVEGATKVTSVDTCALGDRPAHLACETLTFDEVYDRAGVDVRRSPHRDVVPLSAAGADHEWSDAELLAAMRQYWSNSPDDPGWAVWTLFAGIGKRPSLLGSMFDSSDAHQRQGVALFNDAFEQYFPAGTQQRADRLRRERFFGLVRTTGYCFNLHNAWLYFNDEVAWPFFNNADGQPTFMSVPLDPGFYPNFRYEFHESELKWLRHAPDPFVEMGAEPFYGGVNGAGHVLHPGASPWGLSLDLHRADGVFEFLEPVTLTATLTNTSPHPQVVDESVLEDADNFALLVARGDDGPARTWRPFVRHGFRAVPCCVEPGGSVEASFFVGAGLDGWYLAEPGGYTLQAMLRAPGFDVASRPHRVRIAHPCGRDEEVAALDLFTKDVGRAFAFGVSHGITAPAETLRDVVDRLPRHAVARHAALALAQPWMRDRRVLRAGKEGRGFDLIRADPEEVRRLTQQALDNDQDGASLCFGARRYGDLSRGYSAWLVENGAASSSGPPSRSRRARGR
jgi:hypothetical protein